MYQIVEKLMKERGETAADLSRATGISEALLSMWKSRASNNGGFSFENIMKLANHFEVPPETFITEKE